MPGIIKRTKELFADIDQLYPVADNTTKENLIKLAHWIDENAVVNCPDQIINYLDKVRENLLIDLPF